MALALTNIKLLLDSLRNNNWYITAFPMDNFYGHNYAVVFEDLRAIDRGSKYYAVELTFIDMADEKRILTIRANTYGFNNVPAALDYFEIPKNNVGRYPEFAIYNVLNNICPIEFHNHPNQMIKYIVTTVNHRDHEHGDGLCCFKAVRNGEYKNKQKHRSEFNTAKTRLLRESLFNRLGANDDTISFYFRQENEYSDAEIIYNFHNS